MNVTNTDEIKKQNKSHPRNNESSSLCTDAHSLHQFILSALAANFDATPTGRGNGGEQKGEGLPLLFT